MEGIEIITVKFKGYKNFSDNHFVGLDDVKKINVIIGKNNIGKTALIESIRTLESGSKLKNFSEKVKEIKYRYRLTKKDIDQLPNLGIINEPKPGLFQAYHMNQWIHFKKNDLDTVVDQIIEFKIKFENKRNPVTGANDKWEISEVLNLLMISEDLVGFFGQNERNKNYLKTVLKIFLERTIKTRYSITELSADRDLKPEIADNNVTVYPDGSGATNIIQNYISKANKDGSIVEEDMLNALNEIMVNDIEFTRISIQDVSDEKAERPLWEIFLHEKDKPPIALSDSGSGLRTILLVLIKLILEVRTDDCNIVIFEELENNLHPAIQRNLYRYIFQWAMKYNQYVFITTHSNVPIDMVVHEEEAQLIHVHKRDGLVYTSQILDSLGSDNIFNDLEVKASDLLQSNGIIWVEGPSDRIYINKWIELCSEGELIENKHYQIMFYGGKLLSHLSGDSNFFNLTNQEENHLIELLLINRNAAIVIDSDRDAPRKHINDTKNRIKKEFEDKNKFVWITDGREMENYLSLNSLKKIYSVDRAIKRYEIIGVYLKESIGKDNYSNNKPSKARELVEGMCKDDLNVLDLNKRINSLVKEIKKWNNL